MKNLSNYINERLVLSKSKSSIDDLSDIDLNSNQCIIRLGDFYCWYWGVATFKDLKKDLSNFEYCCGNNKGEFKGSAEELIDYLFNFVKNGEDFAVCTIISGSHDWEFEIDFKDIEFDETSIDPLPKNVIHRLPDNFSNDIELSESLLNERLVLSKNGSKYPLTYEKIDTENGIDVEFDVGDPGSYNDSLLAGYIQYGDNFDNIGVFVLKDIDTCNICFLDSKVKLSRNLPYYTSHVNMHGNIEGNCETSNWLLRHFVSACNHCKPLSLNIFTDDLELPDFLHAISTSKDDYSDAIREDIIDLINDLFDTNYTADDICED